MDNEKLTADEEITIAKIMENFENSRALLKAMGNDSRQSVLLAIISGGCKGIRVGDIMKQTHFSHPAVAEHIKVLKDNGVVTVRREGTMNFYRCSFSDSNSCLREFLCMVDEVKARDAAK
jgi:ArsR family transcriptional regulator